MKLLKRLALTTLLLMFAIGAVFGYASWRRHKLIAEINSIRKEGHVDVNINDHWFWPTASKEAHITLFDYVVPDAKKLTARLKRIGVEHVKVSYGYLWFPEGVKGTRVKLEAYSRGKRPSFPPLPVEVRPFDLR